MSKVFYLAAVLLLLCLCVVKIQSAPNLFDDDDVVDAAAPSSSEQLDSIVRHKRGIGCNRWTGDTFCGITCQCGGSCRNGVCVCWRPRSGGRC